MFPKAGGNNVVPSTAPVLEFKVGGRRVVGTGGFYRALHSLCSLSSGEGAVDFLLIL